MKAESEVAISFAISIFSNEEFKADDNRLNYDSYEELGLICGKCRELIFFKQGTKRISHFSHFRDTGKDCPWRTESHSNTQSSDSYKREQSLQEFQTKFRGIVERAIIRYRQILSPQLYTQIAEGKSLVSTYKIDIESWVRWFNLNRKQLENLANNLYQSNELVSERNQRILLNFLDYLCVPASEYILIDILYYVFGLLDKEISLKKYLEEVPSKVIELMSYADWEKEDQVAQESLTFNEFPGYTHPNLPAKPPKSATITERIEPKPIKLDGARTNDHEYQLRAIIGNVPCLLTFKKSFHLWDVIALPVKVSPYHLAVYLSDKVGSTELLNHIKTQLSDLNLNLARNEVKIEEVTKQLTNLPDNDYFLPGSRRLKVELESLVKVSDGINDIIHSLDGLSLDIKDRKFPRPIDVLESTKIIEKCLREEYIKPESSYTDDYYRWHNLGTLRIIEQVEREKPTYTLTILGDEKDTRRSSIPLVMNWLRRVPKILQDHFKEDYPTNEEIKSHLMSIYPFYKRKLREGDKIDKSFINLEADMIIKTKGRLIIEIYFNGQLQTSQLLSITKPVNNPERQGKIPVKISSNLNLTSPDVLTHLLRCDEYKQTFEAQNLINRLVQKFVDSNIQLFTKEKEERIVNRVALKDLLGFSKDSKGLPQVAKQFNRFALPLTSESEVDLGKFVNLLTLETYDRHDTQNLFEAMVNNWKHWNKGGHISLGGFMLLCRNPGDLMTKIYHTAKHNPDRSQVVWGEFIDQLYLLSKLPIGFRTSEGVLLTPGSLLPTDRKTWEHRIRIQLISIIKEGDKTRTLGIESLLQRDIYSLYSLLNRLQPGWNNNEDINKHLQALHDTLAAEGDTEAIPEIPDTVEETQNHLESSSEVLEVNPEITQPIETTEEVSQVLEVIPENVEEITDPISHRSEVSEIKQETEHIIPEIVEPLEVSSESIQPIEVKSEVIAYTNDSTLTLEDNEPVELGDLNVYVALKTTDGLQIKKRIDLPLKKFLPLLNGWLYCSQQLREFKQVLSSTPHNALTLYLNDPIVWFVQDVKTTENITLDSWLQRETLKDCQRLNCTRLDNLLYDDLRGNIDQSLLRRYEKIKNSIINKENYHTQTIQIEIVRKQLRNNKEVSEGVAEIRTQTKGMIQRSKRASIPEIGSIFEISPIKEEVDGNTYLVQEYIERVENTYVQKSQRIALFDGGKLLYHTDLEEKEQHIIDEHLIEPLIEVDGINIFPSASINQVKLETLECSNPNEPIENHIYETKKRTYYVDKFGVKHPYESASEIPAGKIESSFYHASNVFNRVLPPAPDTKKSTHRTVKTERKTPKPIRLENEKVVSGSLKFCDVIGTVPAIMKLNPSLTGYTLTALPVKLPDNLTYDLARYIAGNVPKFSAINYLHDRIKFLQSLSCDKFGDIPRTALISMLNNLLNGVIDEKKIDPAKFIESKNKLREDLNNSPFLTSTRDQYYGSYELAKLGIKQEIEDQEYQYRLTNLMPDDRAFYRHNLGSVLNFVRRVTYNLRNHFKTQKPDTKQIREYLQSKFNYSNCKLNVYWGEGKPRKGLIMEISFKGQVISEHHILIIDPANTEQKYTTPDEEGKLENHARHYGIIPTTISILPSFNDYNDNAVFYAFLKAPKTDKELVTFAKSQLTKVMNKYVSANRNKLVGDNKNAVQVTVAKSVGFIDTGHGYNAIKKTFLKFITPFTFESEVNIGKVVDLKTLKPYTVHDSTFLLEKITAGWKTWNKASDRFIELGQQQFRKENPGKLMLNVHNLINSNPELSTIIWDDLINTFYHLSKLSLGFKANNGVILTPFDIYSNDVERWEHRIKIQLISILKDGDKTRTLGIESLLQREIEDLYSILDRLSPNWNTNQDINKHLAELHDCLSTAKKLNP